MMACLVKAKKKQSTIQNYIHIRGLSSHDHETDVTYVHKKTYKNKFKARLKFLMYQFVALSKCLR